MRCRDRSRTIYYSSLTWTHRRCSFSPSWLSASNKMLFSSSSASLSLRFPASLPPVFQSGIASLRKRFPTESGFIICESKAVFLQVGGFDLQKRFSRAVFRAGGRKTRVFLWRSLVRFHGNWKQAREAYPFSDLKNSLHFALGSVGFFLWCWIDVRKKLSFCSQTLEFSPPILDFCLCFCFVLGSSRIYSLDWFDRG